MCEVTCEQIQQSVSKSYFTYSVFPSQCSMFLTKKLYFCKLGAVVYVHIHTDMHTCMSVQYIYIIYMLVSQYVVDAGGKKKSLGWEGGV